jgi:vancomycin permeability regulator SanA
MVENIESLPTESTPILPGSGLWTRSSEPRKCSGRTKSQSCRRDFTTNEPFYIASHFGLDAIGFNAPDVDAYNSFNTRCREQFAKVMAVVDVSVLNREPRFLGEKVQIGLAPNTGGIR